MKKQYLLLASAFLLSAGSLFSQSQECSTDERVRKAFKENPQYEAEYTNFRAFAKKYTKTYFNQANKSADTVLQIPIVFHIVHNYGSANISDAQIQSALTDMNKQWRKLMPDTGQIQAPFDLIHEDMKVEFVLAKKDPTGNCTDGITRHVSTLTYSASDNVKTLTKSKLDWPCNMYLNVWVVSNIASGAGGYSYFPGISCGIDGIVVLAGQLSALAHEAGHWLGLPHPWGFTNNNADPGNCSDDDNIDDTPNTIGQVSCWNLSNNTCNDSPVPFTDVNNNIIWPSSNGEIHDNVQNVMDYGFCGPENFTQGQKAVTRAYLQTVNSSGNRDDLVSVQNRDATGIRSSFTCSPKPVVDFDISYEYVCTTFGNEMKNNTYNSTSITYDWDFEGGTSTNPTAKNAIGEWTTPGKYDVSLTATSAGGVTSVTKQKLAKIVSGTLTTPFVESFASETFPVNDTSNYENDWFIDGLSSNNTWHRDTISGSNSLSSLKLDIKTSPGTHRLISPYLDMSQATCDSLYFDVAYAKRSSASNDRLVIKVSKTCARTWSDANIVEELTASQLSTTSPILSGGYTPEPSDWKRFGLNLSKFSNDQIHIMFELQTSNGNTIYLDNINIGCEDNNNYVIADTVVVNNPIDTGGNNGGTESIGKFAKVNFSIFPNPTTDDASIKIVSANPVQNIMITDLTGKVIANKNFNTNDNVYYTSVSEVVGDKLSKGVYLVTISNSISNKTQKLVIK